VTSGGLTSAPTKARVTVGVVVKDCEGTILETVKSIFAQNYPHELMEAIVIDGGSRDKTLSVITEAVSTTDVLVRIFSDGGRGLGYARQMVVDEAHGDYVIWVDGDATIPEHYVSNLVGFMECHARHGGTRGTQEANNEKDLHNRIEHVSLALRNAARDIFDTNGQIFRVEAIRQVGGFDLQIKRSGEDVDLILRMMKAGWSFCVIQVKFYHRIGSWKEVCRKRVRSGYGYHYRLHKHTVVTPLFYQILPLIFLVGIKDAISAYRLTGRNVSFLLPFWYCVICMPWCIGFCESHIDGYGHA
jgi:glycosyltransferase involved in cell wall biosynthesis